MFLYIQAGAFTSFAREAAEDEARDSVAGLSSSINQIEDLLVEYPENANLLELRAYLVEESRTLGRRFSGEGKYVMMHRFFNFYDMTNDSYLCCFVNNPCSCIMGSK